MAHLGTNTDMTLMIYLGLSNFVLLLKSRETISSVGWDFPNCSSSSWLAVIIGA